MVKFTWYTNEKEGRVSLLVGEFGFIRWWTVLLPQQILNKGTQWVALVGDAFAVKQMLQHINEPIFQDPTWQGRFIGMGIRILRILLGLLVQGLAFVIVGLLVLLWYGFPLLAIWGVVV